MNAVEIISELEARGVELRPKGNRILYRPVESVTEDEVELLRQHKAEVLAILHGHPEGAESARRFGAWWACLFPFLGHEVLTPHGAGELVQVFGDLATVVIRDRAVFLPPEEVEP